MITSTTTDAFLVPERIVRYFDLEAWDHVADFGAGHGYFTIPMAQLVGGNGKVYAIDIQKPVLETIKARAKLEHLLNVEAVWADLEKERGSRLKDRFLDFTVISNILFQAENKEALFQEAYRILREGGRLAVIEWGPEENSSFGPARDLRIKKEVVRELAEQAGFNLMKEFEAGIYHYGLLFKKS